MKFYIKKVYLWFSEDDKTVIDFDADKVNVVRGNSSRGKSNIFAIIDYCLMSDKPNIVEPVINQYTEYYGLEFQLGDTHYSVSRRKPEDGVGASHIYMDSQPFAEDYYPGKANPNRQVSEARRELDRKFGLTEERYIYPWGQEADVPFVVSFRSFLMFNALTENIISTQYEFLNYKFFEDTYADDRQKRDYLFDVLLGIDGVKEEEQRKLTAELSREQESSKRRRNKFEKARNLFDGRMEEAVRCLEQAGVAVSSLRSPMPDEQKIRSLENLVEEYTPVTDGEKMQRDGQLLSLRQELYGKRLMLANLVNASREYDAYCQEVDRLKDSLRPVDYLHKHLKKLGITMWSNMLLEELRKSLLALDERVPSKEQFVSPEQIRNVKEDISRLEGTIQQYSRLKIKPVEESMLYMAIGKVAAMIPTLRELLDKIPSAEPQAVDHVRTEQLRQAANAIISEIQMRRSTVVKDLLNPAIQSVFDQFTQLENFAGCKTRYDREHERLELSDGSSILNYNNVGSQSNYMFLHLSFFLGLHKFLHDNPCPQVGSFLFIDQPSIPYYESSDDERTTDKAKLLDAFRVIDDFMDYMTSSGDSFQVILIEHAPTSYWTGDNALKHFVTKKEFEGSEALVPYSVIEKKKADERQD